jgi:type I restriction enzyme M protein
LKEKLMPTTTHDIVAKLWNLCNVLKDDGVTYHQYVTELTYLLFLKMAKETGREEGIPAEWRWDVLETLQGLSQFNHYKELLLKLGSSSQAIEGLDEEEPGEEEEQKSSPASPIVTEIYANASTFIKKPDTLKRWDITRATAAPHVPDYTQTASTAGRLPSVVTT